MAAVVRVAFVPRVLTPLKPPLRKLLPILGILGILTVAWAAAFVKFESEPPQYDAYAWQSVPEANNGGSNNFQITSYNRPPYNMRGFIQFDISHIPKGSMILSATLRMRVWWKSEPDSAKNVGDPTGRSYGASPMLAPWEEYRINWSNQPAYDDRLSAVSRVPLGQGGWLPNRTKLWMEWNIRAIVAEWMNGKPNYGLLIRDLDENSTILYSTQFFTHNQVPGPDYFPQLELAYVIPSGVPLLYALIAGWIGTAIYVGAYLVRKPNSAEQR